MSTRDRSSSWTPVVRQGVGFFVIPTSLVLSASSLGQPWTRLTSTSWNLHDCPETAAASVCVATAVLSLFSFAAAVVLFYVRSWPSRLSRALRASLFSVFSLGSAILALLTLAVWGFSNCTPAGSNLDAGFYSSVVSTLGIFLAWIFVRNSF